MVAGAHHHGRSSPLRLIASGGMRKPPGGGISLDSPGGGARWTGETALFETWGPAGVYHGSGVCRINFGEAGLPGAGEIYGHAGFPQAFMFYWPGQEVTIVGTLNQALTKNVHNLDLTCGVIDLLQH